MFDKWHKVEDRWPSSISALSADSFRERMASMKFWKWGVLPAPARFMGSAAPCFSSMLGPGWFSQPKKVFHDAPSRRIQPFVPKNRFPILMLSSALVDKPLTSNWIILPSAYSSVDNWVLGVSWSQSN